MKGLLFWIILSYHSVLSLNCSESCPSDKPYCSEVGCIFECPEPFYINGSDCVSDCGNMFVDENRHCIFSCPKQTFYKETLKTTVLKPYLERKCIDCSAHNLLVSNDSCVNVCPSEVRHIEENKCVPNCSADRPYMIITTLYGLPHFKCTSKCPAVEDKGFCKELCPVYKDEFNHSCYEQCPEQSPFLLEDMCMRQCPHNAPALGHHNKSCKQTKCPEDKPFVFNNTCVDSCPDTFPFINSTFKDNKGFRYCTEDCENKYQHDNNCVNACPSHTVAVEKACVESCPTYAPYVCKVAVGSKCEERNSGRLTHAICVNKCPGSMLILNNTCVFSCRSGLQFDSDCMEKCPAALPYIVNNTCVENCPDTFPFVYSTFNDNKGFLSCLEDCGSRYRFKSNCLDACPSQTVAVENTCVEHCPMYTSYICRVAVGGKCGEMTDGKPTHAICVNECPPSMLIWNDTCVVSCKSGQSIFGKECTENCPPDSPYEKNVTSTVDCRYDWLCKFVKKLLTCVKGCPLENYIYNKTCFQYCPPNFLYSGRFCVSKCPEAEPYIENATLTVENWSYSNRYYYYYYYELKRENRQIQKCVPACGPGLFSLNFTCVKSCSDQYVVTENRTCLKQNCSTKYKEITNDGIVCLEKCKSATFSLNNTCVDTCTGTEMEFHVNGTCIEKCPPDYYNIVVSVSNEVHRNSYWTGDVLFNNCTKDCGDEYFQYNGTCINFCQPPLLTFENTCVKECPFNAQFYLTTSVTFIQRSFERGSSTFQRKDVRKTILKCEVNCPNNTVSLDLKCVQTCPLNRRYIVNGSCTSDDCNTKYRFFHSSGIICYDECPKHLFVSNATCVLQCSEKQFVYNQTCVNICPTTHPIIDENIFPGEACDRDYTTFICVKSLIYVRECSNSCPRQKHIYDHFCHDICPGNTVAHANECIEVCPKSHLYVERKIITIKEWEKLIDDEHVLHSVNRTKKECVVQCSEEHPLQFRNSCLSNCPENFPYKANNLCVETCPENKLADLKTKQCVDKCAETYGEFNKSCHSHCPEPHKYIYASRCVSECPSSHPVALEEDRYICRKSCADSKLFKDGECIYNFECDDPMFGYNGLCIYRCPEGFVWFDKCLNLLPVKVAIGVLAAMLLGLILISGQNILDFISALRLVFLSEETIKEMEKQQIHSNSNSKQNGERKVLQDEIELLPNMETETVV